MSLPASSGCEGWIDGRSPIMFFRIVGVKRARPASVNGLPSSPTARGVKGVVGLGGRGPSRNARKQFSATVAVNEARRPVDGECSRNLHSTSPSRSSAADAAPSPAMTGPRPGPRGTRAVGAGGSERPSRRVSEGGGGACGVAPRRAAAAGREGVAAPPRRAPVGRLPGGEEPGRSAAGAAVPAFARARQGSPPPRRPPGRVCAPRRGALASLCLR